MVTSQNRTPSEHERDIEKLAGMIKHVHVAMLTTQTEDGRLHSRPMATQDTSAGALADRELWFFTRTNDPKCREIEREPRVNVAYADPDRQNYVSFAGRARIVRDEAKAKELWHPGLRAWFPIGPEDPELSLLRVDVESAEYWDAPSSTMVVLAGLAKAALTGRPAGTGSTKKVDLR